MNFMKCIMHTFAACTWVKIISISIIMTHNTFITFISKIPQSTWANSITIARTWISWSTKRGISLKWAINMAGTIWKMLYWRCANYVKGIDDIYLCSLHLNQNHYHLHHNIHLHIGCIYHQCIPNCMHKLQ